MITAYHDILIYFNAIKETMVKQEQKTMTRINSTINSDLEKQFREVVYKTYGLKKGSIQKALEKAIGEWIKKYG